MGRERPCDSVRTLHLLNPPAMEMGSAGLVHLKVRMVADGSTFSDSRGLRPGAALDDRGLS